MPPPDERDDKRTADINGMVPLSVADESTAPIAHTCRLVCIAGTDLGRTFGIATSSVTIGRGEVEVSLHATDISRSHARISRRDKDHVIEDLGSANGTFVNGVRITGAVTLRASDRIQIGGTILIFSHHDELEQRMQRVQRLEALAALTSGLAHDFNNAMSAILGSLGVFERELGTEHVLQPMLADLRMAATSASALAQRLQKLGRMTEPLELTRFDLAPIIERAVGLMRRQLPPGTAFDLDLPAGLALRGSQEELHQVLLNLILNARDAMPNGGTIRIAARAITLDGAEAVAKQLPMGGGYVELVVADTGVGMDEATQARVFEPFFTTKPGRGAGLGLTMVQSVVARYGGSIVVTSAPEQGTTFTMFLAAG